jgi:hypothetical protein
MQLLVLPVTAAGTQPIYLPYDKAPVPFGDPMVATQTAATPTVITIPGYTPSQNDAISFAVAGAASSLLASSVGLTASVFQLNQVYYATPAGGDTFTLSTGKSTSTQGITSVASWNTASANTAANMIGHLLSNQVDGTTIPFKPNNTVLAINTGAVSGTGTVTLPITLFTASDLSSTLNTGVYGYPLGPTAYKVLATVAFGVPQLLTLNGDWIVASGNTGSLVLIQN